MSDAERATIVVAGAGIGGLTAAVALSRRGRRVLVVERHGEAGEAGTAITLWPNALSALDVIGVGPSVRDLGAAVFFGGMQRPDGSWVRRFDDRRLRHALGGALVVVSRGDLLAALCAALDPSVIRFGAEVESYRVVPGPAVEVRLADGTVLAAAGLMGADGAGSAVARQLQPGLEPSYAGYTAWRGVATADISHFTPSQTWGPGGEFGYLPMRGGRTYWFATENTAEAGHEPDGEQHHLRRRFAGWHDPIGQLIAATGPEAILRHDIYDRTLAVRWSDGPVVVIGDAAHPMRPHLGQGGCQAIEDGVLLAAAVDGRADLAAAFSRYARVRRPRVRRIVRESALIGRAIQGSGPWTAAVGLNIRFSPERAVLRHLAGIGGTRAVPVR
jgi:2-polyprenyl-6-methoxyphenol hydroxylase-like FAD-dependent oxidoreductase